MVNLVVGIVRSAGKSGRYGLARGRSKYCDDFSRGSHCRAQAATAIDELERKWAKAQGRHSNAYWTAEWLDLAYAHGRIIASKMRPAPIAPNDVNELTRPRYWGVY